MQATAGGEIILYDDQTKSLWNEELITRGNYFLKKAAAWNTLSKYYLEASIAYWHSIKTGSIEKWGISCNSTSFIATEYSPIAALNRTMHYLK